MKLFFGLLLAVSISGCGSKDKLLVSGGITGAQSGFFSIEQDHADKIPDEFNKTYACAVSRVDSRIKVGTSMESVEVTSKDIFFPAGRVKLTHKVSDRGNKRYVVRVDKSGSEKGDSYDGTHLVKEFIYDSGEGGWWEKRISETNVPKGPQSDYIMHCEEPNGKGPTKFGKTKYYTGKYTLESGLMVSAIKIVSEYSLATYSCKLLDEDDKMLRKIDFVDVTVKTENIKTYDLPNMSKNCRKKSLLSAKIHTLKDGTIIHSVLDEVLKY